MNMGIVSRKQIEHYMVPKNPIRFEIVLLRKDFKSTLTIIQQSF